MRKTAKSAYTPASNSRFAVLSAHYNIRYDGLFDEGAGKALLAILAQTAPTGKDTHPAGKQGKTNAAS